MTLQELLSPWSALEREKLENRMLLREQALLVRERNDLLRETRRLTRELAALNARKAKAPVKAPPKARAKKEEGR
jgi:hypothetical protein